MAYAGQAKAAFGTRAPPIAANDDGAAGGFPEPGFPERAFPELDCVRALLDPGVIARAEDRAERLGIGADRALIASGALSEEAYLRALAQTLGVAFEPLDCMPRAMCPLDDARLIEAAAAGLLPLAHDDELCLVLAPRGTAARRIARLIRNNPGLARRFRFTSTERLTRFVLRCAGKMLAGRATERLKQEWPEFSAAPPARFRRVAAMLGMLGLAALTAPWAPPAAAIGLEALLAAMFVAWLGLRLACAFVTNPDPPPPTVRDDADVPVYSVVAALYREAASVDGLLRAIARLDYPPEKLDVILAVEAGDRETRAAIAARTSRMPVTVIAVPAIGPRTKPKALNVALPFARGAFTVIYDAEDRPEPDQLRRALQAFRDGGERLACVQARLCIDNTADSWLARYFTAEYAGQFDVVLPGLAHFRLPLPLGGTSNHFRTATLRAAGGWDSFNVTEDADLGIRLARLGHRAETIASTTYEEAPARLGPWLRQRTRWFKGWMQTWAVHMREPRRLARELGIFGFLAFQLLVGGSALAALAHPLLVAGLAWSATSRIAHAPDGAAAATQIAMLCAMAGFGYLASAFVGWIGLRRRGLAAHAWVLLLTPVQWLLLSVAAWRALWQLLAAPYLWEKTEHGLAKHSRLAAAMTRSLVALERHLGAIKTRGELPVLGGMAAHRVAAAPGHAERIARRAPPVQGTTIEKLTALENP